MCWFNRLALILMGLSLLALTGCSIPNTVDISEQIPQREYWPTEDWQKRTIVTPDGSFLFKDLSTQISSELPFVNSFIVVSHGYIVYEDYFNALQPKDSQLVQSVAKSVTSALVGIALDQGDISSVNVTLGEVLPEYFKNDQSTISPKISIRDALMMRSGMRYDVVSAKLAGEFDSLEAYDAYLDTQLQEHLIDDVLSVPQAYGPGIAWQYNTADAQLVSEMFQKLVGRSLSEYAGQYLFAPLGINNYAWRHDAKDVTVGGALLWLRPSDMAKFGYLFLNNGYWDSGQIVSKEWVHKSTQSQGLAINMDPFAIKRIKNYGYLWWLWEPGSFGVPNGAYQALGYGGQIILVLPDIDTVIVTTSNPLVNVQVSDEQQWAIIKFIDQYVIRELTSQKESLQFIGK
jgi:CubicO group peptidase (beta-lactamase class C family)